MLWFIGMDTGAGGDGLGEGADVGAEGIVIPGMDCAQEGTGANAAPSKIAKALMHIVS
jgi:hypothetical protein